MSEKAKITFFSINKCGYYSVGRKGALEQQFGGLAATLSQIQRWARGSTPVQLAQTQTYAQTEGSDLLPAFLFDVAENEGEWLMVLWNQTPAMENSVASVKPDELVGKASVIENAIAKGSLPGFPSYYWFQPRHNRMAGVRLAEYAVAGHAQLQAYMTGFLTRTSMHAVTRNSGHLNAPGLVTEGLEVLGYRDKQDDGPRQDVNPMFRSSLMRLPGDVEYILARHAKIRRVINRTILGLGNRGEDLALWQNMWRKFGLGQRNAVSEKKEPVKVEYAISTELTKAQVQAMVDAHEQGISSWEDIGFQMQGEQNPRWLGKSYARGDVELSVKRDAASVVSAAPLLQALQAQRSEIDDILG